MFQYFPQNEKCLLSTPIIHSLNLRLVSRVSLVKERPWERGCPNLSNLNTAEYYVTELRALSFCQNWPVRPVILQTKCYNLKKQWHDTPSHSSGGVYIVVEDR